MQVLRTFRNLFSSRLHSLPIVIVYVTDKCNSRCICCDYWRAGRREMPLQTARRLAQELSRFGTRYVLLSGGEPLQHTRWEEVASLFKQRGMKVALATSGIQLPRNAAAVGRCIDELFVSLDGADPEFYRAIRGVDGFDLVKRGIAMLAGSLPITFRTTVQRLNYRQIPALIRISRSWGGTHHSFLAVDVHTHAAFARAAEFDATMALTPADLDAFSRVLDEIEHEFSAEFAEGYILESPARMRRLHAYFAAIQGSGSFPPVHCNAPRFSAVIETDGSVKPCFFLPAFGRTNGMGMRRELNSPEGVNLRRQQVRGKREECVRCVCPAFWSVRRFLGGP